MPMLVTEATLPGNPIVFANAAFMNVSGYSLAELVGQDGEQSCTAGRASPAADQGKSAFHFVLGGARFNSLYSQPQIDMDGRVMVSALYGALRIQLK